MTRFLRPFASSLSKGLLVLAIALAPPAHAQLGLDLSAPTGKEKPAKKGDAKKKKATEKKATTKKAPKPGRAAPARPAPAREAPPAPLPAPAPPPAAPVPPPETRAEPRPAAPEPPPRPAPRERAPQQQPGLTLTPVDKAASAAAKARLDAAKKLLDEKATETAALAYDQILRDKALEPAHDEARYQRAKALARLELRYSALNAFDEVLERGPAGSRFFHSAMEWLFYVGRGLANEQPLMSRVARFAGRGVPPAYEDRVNYLLAKYEFERGRALAESGRSGEAKTSYQEARRLAERVGGRSGTAPLPSSDAGERAPAQDPQDVVARARFVDGLVSYAQGDDQGASDAFKDVVRMTNPKKVARADQELRELAFLQLARIHYQNRQNRYAIFYYGRMPWGGERWLEGLWEASWAYYRIGDYEKALGNLLTLQSPYFKDEYFPESYVLKAIVYYENCRYPEARQVLEQFSSIYNPVYEELVRLTAAQRTPDGWYELVRNAERHPGSAATRKILKIAFSDQNVAHLAESVGEMEREVDVGIGRRRPEFRESALGKELVDKLRVSRAAAVEELGARTRAKLELERDGLRQLLAQALRIQIEVSRKEREALEGSLAKGSQVEVVKNLKYSHAVSDEHLYWPYEGEFWRDELGTYSYTLTKGCKDRLPRSRTAAR
jgi:tetratricopeptide (TPR) repeat protein